MPINYTKAKIYKLTTPHNVELVYYGSTVNPLYKRKGCHKSLFKINKNNCTSKQLFELGIDDVIITLVENVNCNTKEELLQRERFYIENNNCVNKTIPLRTNKEYREANIDIILDNAKEYYKDNKDKIKDKRKDYYEDNKDKILDYKKDYYEDNKDKIKDYQKEYNRVNKDIKKENRKKYYEENKDKFKKYYDNKKKDKFIL